MTRAPGAALLAMTAVSVLDSSDGHAAAMKQASALNYKLK